MADTDTREEQGKDVDNPNEGHPLLNQVVASKVFEFVKLPDLRSLRLVCKDWYDVSLPTWRRTVQINIHNGSSNQGLLNWKSLGTELGIARDIPFRNFCLYTAQFLADISKACIDISEREMDPPSLEGKYRNMDKFWVNYGHWIHRLELKYLYVTDLEALKRAIFEQTPNLQELTLYGLADARGWDWYTGANVPLPDETKDEGPAQPNLNLKAFAIKGRCSDFPIGWRLLFNRFPNVEKLDQTYDHADSNEVVECLENMLMSPSRRPNLPITDLGLRFLWLKFCV